MPAGHQVIAKVVITVWHVERVNVDWMLQTANLLFLKLLLFTESVPQYVMAV